MYKIINEKAPLQFRDTFSYVSGGSRDCENCNLYYTKKSRSHKQFYYLGAKCCNTLPQSLRHADSANKKSSSYKTKFLNAIKIDAYYKVDNSFDIFYLLCDGA